MINQQKGSPFRSAWAALVAMLISLLLSVEARAEEGLIDRATVRVLALTGFEISQAQRENVEVSVAVPAISHGSGFVAAKNGLIVTAAHVVEGSRFVAVHVPGMMGARAAKVVHRNQEQDIAFLRVVEKLPAAADWSKARKLKARQTVFAVGYPLDSTRSDAQSFKGAVSSFMPDGRIQLSLSVNPGNSGGPLVDDKEHVYGVISQGANVEAGVTGLAIAVPLGAFEKELRRESKARTDLSELESEAATVLTELLTMEQSPESSLLRAATTPDSDRGKAADTKIRKYAALMSKNADIAMYGAAFYWNMHLARAAVGENSEPERNNALKLISIAKKLDGSYQSTFATFAESGEGGLVHVDGETRTSIADLKTVRFEAPEGIVLHGRVGELQGIVATQYGPMQIRRDVYEEVCDKSCDVSFTPGSYQLALSEGDGRKIPLDEPIALDGKSDLHAHFEDNIAYRISGLLVMLGGIVGGGTLTLVAALTPTCDSSGGNCKTNTTGLVIGGLGFAAGFGIGIPLLSVGDDVGINLVPRGGGGYPGSQKQAGASLEWSGRF